MEDILREFSRLKSAVIDSSSIIYADKAGFLQKLFTVLMLKTTPGVIRETGIEDPRLNICDEQRPGGARSARGEQQTGWTSVDRGVEGLALRLKLPLISDDKKILMRFKASGLPFYNSLMILHFLLYRGFLTLAGHETYKEKLLAVARYGQNVLSFGNTLYMEIVKRI